MQQVLSASLFNIYENPFVLTLWSHYWYNPSEVLVNLVNGLPY